MQNNSQELNSLTNPLLDSELSISLLTQELSSKILQTSLKNYLIVEQNTKINFEKSTKKESIYSDHKLKSETTTTTQQTMTNEIDTASILDILYENQNQKQQKKKEKRLRFKQKQKIKKRNLLLEQEANQAKKKNQQLNNGKLSEKQQSEEDKQKYQSRFFKDYLESSSQQHSSRNQSNDEQIIYTTTTSSKESSKKNTEEFESIYSQKNDEVLQEKPAVAKLKEINNKGFQQKQVQKKYKLQKEAQSKDGFIIIGHKNNNKYSNNNQYYPKSKQYKKQQQVRKDDLEQSTIPMTKKKVQYQPNKVYEKKTSNNKNSRNSQQKKQIHFLKWDEDQEGSKNNDQQYFENPSPSLELSNLQYSFSTASKINPKDSNNNFANNLFQTKVKHEIDKCLDNIHLQNKNIYYSRQTVLNRIKFLVKNIFSQQKGIKTYGSCATGLQLATSDIDIALTGFAGIDELFVLQTLLKNLQFFSWVISYQAIFTANVPILKLKIDPVVDFLQFTYPDPPINYIYKNNTYETFNLTTEQKQQHWVINVDLSIEHIEPSFRPLPMIQNHIGFLSTELIKQYLDTYHHLFQITLLMKHILSKIQKCSAFEGGMSSYCLVLLIVAYIRDNENDPSFQEKSYSQIFLDILNFYGNKFDPKETGITFFYEKSPYFPLNKAVDKGKLTLYEPITNKKTISENYTQIEDILGSFRTIFGNFTDYQLQIEEKVNQYFQHAINKELYKQQFSELDNSNVNDILNFFNIDNIKFEEFLEEFRENSVS